MFNFILGVYNEMAVCDLQLRRGRPPMPFSHVPLLRSLTHTFWFMPSVASCFAMRNLLAERQNNFYYYYKVIAVAGTSAIVGVDFALN